MREIISLYNPHTSETDLGRIKFLSHSGLLAECILWTRRVHVKIHDSSAIYASTRRVYILTRRVAHSSYFWAEDLMTFDMGIGSILWRSFSEHFQEFFPYILEPSTTRDEWHPRHGWVVPMSKVNWRWSWREEISTSPLLSQGSLFQFSSYFYCSLSCIICNGDIA